MLIHNIIIVDYDIDNDNDNFIGNNDDNHGVDFSVSVSGW